MKCALTVVLVLWVSGAASADIFLNQPHDFVDRLSSEEGTAIGLSRTADDFFVPGPQVFQLTRVTVQMVVTFPNTPTDFRLDLYDSDPMDRPGLFAGSMDVVQMTDLGEWNNQSDAHLFQVEFESQIVVFPPFIRIWLSPVAIGNGSGTDRAWWGTAGNGVVNHSQGFFMSSELGFPDWTAVSDPGLLGFESDFAMVIEGELIPAPPVAALPLLALLAAKRRRRG